MEEESLFKHCDSATTKGVLQNQYDFDEGSDEDSGQSNYESSEIDTEDDGAEAWDEVYLRTASQLKIEYNTFERQLLTVVQQEWNAVLDQLEFKVEILNEYSIFQYFVQPVLKHVQRHANEARRQAGKSMLDQKAIINFAQIEMMSAALLVPPSTLFNNEGFLPIVTERVGSFSYSNYLAVLEAIEARTPNTNAFHCDQWLKDLDDLIADICSVCFVEGCTITVMAQDTISKSGKHVPASRSRAPKFKQQHKELERHTMISSLTSLYMGSALQQPEPFAMESIHKCLLYLARNTPIHSNSLTGCLITAYQKNGTLSQAALESGAEDLHTRKRDASFKFTFNRERASGQRVIPEKGVDGAYFAKMGAKIDDQYHVEQHGLACRSKGRVTLVSTTKAEYGSMRFHYQIGNKHVNEYTLPPRSEQLAEIGCDLTVVSIRDTFKSMERGVQLLTVMKEDPSWLIMNRFRITASVATNLIPHWLRIHNNNEFGSICCPDLNSVLEVLGFKVNESHVLNELLMRRSKHEIKNPRLEVDEAVAPRKSEVHGSENRNMFDSPEESNSLRQLLHDNCFMKSTHVSSQERDAIGSSVRLLLPSFVAEATKNQVRMLAMKEYGLVAHKSNEIFSTSVDSVISLWFRETQSHTLVVGDWIPRKNSPDQVSKIVTEHGSFITVCLRFRLDGYADQLNLFHKVIPDPKYRQQVMHHCACLQMASALYVESVQERIKYAVLVEFDNVTLETYRKEFVESMGSYFEPVHRLSIDDQLDPVVNKLLKGVKLGLAVDRDTYKLALAQWILLNTKVHKENKPLPSCKKFLPAMLNACNKLQTGADEFVDFMEKREPMNRNRKFNGNLFSRAFTSMLINSHLVIRAFEILRNPKHPSLLKRFATYDQFKAALNERTSFTMFCYIGWKYLTNIKLDSIEFRRGLYCDFADPTSSQDDDADSTTFDDNPTATQSISTVSSSTSDKHPATASRTSVKGPASSAATNPAEDIVRTQLPLTTLKRPHWNPILREIGPSIYNIGGNDFNGRHSLNCSKKRKRCAYCCSYCVTGTHKENMNARVGYPCATGCRECFIQAHRLEQLKKAPHLQFRRDQVPEGIVYLCRVPRGENASKSCFELFHERGIIPNHL